MLNIYLVRHGESELNQQGVYYGHTDCKLTSKGKQQAEEVSNKLEDIIFTNIVASPLQRAYDTAKIISNGADQITTDVRLMEMNFGEWENKDYKTIGKNYKVQWLAFCNDFKATAPPGGESLLDVYDRTKEFLDELLKLRKDGNLLIVSHQGSLRLIISILLGMGIEGFWHFTFHQGCYSHLQIDEKGHCSIMKINR